MGNCLGKCLTYGRKKFRYSTDEHDELVPPTERQENEGNLIYKIIKFKKKKPTQFIDSFLEQSQEANRYARFGERSATVDSSAIQLQCLDAQNLFKINKTNDTAMNYPSGNGVNSSRASSSLDLEWEHEYGNRVNAINQPWLFMQEDLNKKLSNKFSNNNSEDVLDNSIVFSNFENQINFKDQIKQIYGINQTPKIYTRTSSRASSSHISTPESLEWDIDEEQQKQMKLEDDNLDHETLELLHQIEMLKNKVLNETGEGLENKESTKPS